MLEADTTFRVDPSRVTWREEDNEITIVVTETGASYGLEGTGRVIWHLLLLGHSLAQIAVILEAQYDEAADQIESDVRWLTSRLIEEGVVATANGTPPPAPPPPDQREPYELVELSVYGRAVDLSGDEDIEFE